MSSNGIVWSERGSDWNRWDPHIHAPGTVLNNHFNGDWDAYANAINQTYPPIRALGITDYYSIQSYQHAKSLQQSGKLKNVAFVFPNVEMRLDIKTARGRGINFHLLFSPDDTNHELEIERVLGQLTFEFNSRTYHCSRNELIALGKACEPKHIEDHAAFAEGVNQFKVSFSDLRNLFRREQWIRENCLVAVAAAYGDGLSGLQDDGAFTALREEIQRFAHIILSGQPSDRDFWLGKTPTMAPEMLETKYRGLKPCLHGSDAHALSKVGLPDGNRYCWLKGDLAFETLRQAIIEPDARVWIGDNPPLPPGDSVTIDTIRPLNTPWLKNDALALNRGLVAIIGPRGSGKTALVDLIAAGANALVYPLAESSFLRRATAPNDLIGSAQVEEIWRDGTKNIAAFRPPEEYDFDEVLSSVCYLSQKFVDRLCSSGGLAKELRSEIERVIFEQTDSTDRFGADSFEGLAEVLLSPIRHRREQQINTVSENSDEIAEEMRLHEQLPKMRKDVETLQQTLGKQRKELAELIPKGKEERVKRLLQLEEACTESEGKIEIERRKMKMLEDLLGDVTFITNQAEPKRFAEMKTRFTEADLKDDEWEAFRQEFKGNVKAIITKAKQTADRANKRLLEGDSTQPFDLAATPVNLWPLIILRAERDKVKKEAGVDSERQRKYDALSRTIKANELATRKLEIAIKNAEGADTRRKTLTLARREAYQQLFDTFIEEEEALRALYDPLHRRLTDASGALKKLRFVVRRQVNLFEWVSRGERLLDLRRDSPFRGHGTLAKEASVSLLTAWRSGSAAVVATAMHDFVASVGSDLRKAMPASAEPEGTAEWLRQIGTWLFNSDHISVEYGLEYEGIPVEQLSPGTRGIVLLLLYLAIDINDRRPLLIDQPEENLDPQSIQDDLVPHFRDAVKRRQVIIVTHNANLVVNTDADQVIVASATATTVGGLPTIEYKSGSLENPKIRSAVCDILEGGRRAFLERERRYRLQWEQMIQENEN